MKIVYDEKHGNYEAYLGGCLVAFAKTEKELEKKLKRIDSDFSNKK